MQRLSILKPAAMITIIALLALSVTPLSHASPAVGTVKVDQEDLGGGPGNEPQKNTCSFAIDFYDFQPGTAAYSFELQSPTAGTLTPSAGGTVELSGTGLQASVLVDLSPSIIGSGVAPHSGAAAANSAMYASALSSPVIARTTVSSSSLANEASPVWISAPVSPMTAVASAGVPIRVKLAA